MHHVTCRQFCATG